MIFYIFGYLVCFLKFWLWRYPKNCYCAGKTAWLSPGFLKGLSMMGKAALYEGDFTLYRKAENRLEMKTGKTPKANEFGRAKAS